MQAVLAVFLGIIAGALYTLSPLTAWCVALGAVVLTWAGRGLPSPDRRALHILLVAALVVRLAAIGGLFAVNTPKHDDESVGMLSGDEAYGLSRALRTRDVIAGAPVGRYDYFVASDEYGRTSYITLLTGIQVLFGPTPYSMRLLNTLIFLIAAILLFRAARSAFGMLPALCGLTVLLFLPTLFVWSISLLKEPIYLLGSTLVITGTIAAAKAGSIHESAFALARLAAGIAVVSDLRQGAIALAVAGVACGVAAYVYFSASWRMKIGVAVLGLALAAGAAATPSAQQRVTSALEAAAKVQSGHVFTVGHSYKLLDDGFYVNPVSAAASTLTLTAAQSARYVVRAAVSFVTVPLPWQLASTRELSYLPEQMLWYVLIALLPAGLVAGWRRDPFVTALFAGYALPTAVALALTNGNVGTLLRLRGIVIPALVWLSATGFCAWLQRRAASEGTAAA